MAKDVEVSKQIISEGLVPLAVANTFLFIGSNMQSHDCAFNLGLYFVVVGTLCLSFAVFGALGKFLVGVILDRKIDKCGSMILKIIQAMNAFLKMAECIMLTGGCFFVLAYVGKVSFSPESSGYCQQVCGSFALKLNSAICNYGFRAPTYLAECS